MKKSVLSVIIAYGPDLRTLVYSGILEELAKKYHIVVWIRYPESEVTEKLAYVAEIHSFPNEGRKSKLLNFVQHRFYSIYLRWLRQNGQEKWSYSLPASLTNDGVINGLREKFLSLVSNKYTIFLLAKLEDLLIKNLASPGWAKAFRETETDTLLVSNYFGDFIEPAITGAIREKLKVFVALHSWKDGFVHPRLPMSLSGIFLWTEIDKQQMQRWNPWINYPLWPVGSLHLTTICQKAKIMPRDKFCKISGIDPSKPFVCYTMASPTATIGEDNIVIQIASWLQKNFPDIQLLIRKNPMDNNKSFLFNQMKNITVQQPLWEWVPGINWNAPMPDDVDIWASTIYHSIFNISIPSTVTVEYLTYGKPVVNVLFDLLPPSSEKQSNLRFWHAGYYSIFHNNSNVYPAKTFLEFQGVMTRLLGETPPQFKRGNNIVVEDNIVSKIVALIN